MRYLHIILAHSPGEPYAFTELRRSDLFVEIPESDEYERSQGGLFTKAHVTLQK